MLFTYHIVRCVVQPGVIQCVVQQNVFFGVTVLFVYCVIKQGVFLGHGPMNGRSHILT